MTEVKHRMKRASLERLIEWLKGQDEDHWDMGDALRVRGGTVTWEMMDHGEDLDRVPLCHTVGCFAGHCVLLQAVDKQMMVPFKVIDEGGVMEKAARFMGIEVTDEYQTLKDYLFTPDISYLDVTRAVAIQVLEHIRDKGVLHWGKFMKLRYPSYGQGTSTPLPIELY